MERKLLDCLGSEELKKRLGAFFTPDYAARQSTDYVRNIIKPADYNPRKIKPAQFVKLQESIKQLGCVIPVLVNTQNNIIIAGHQRVKAMQALGIKQVPIYFFL